MMAEPFAPLRLRQGAHVLDIAWGDGGDTSPLNSIVGSTGRVERFDAAKTTTLALPFGDEVFDAVYGDGLFEHARDSHAVISEIYRVVKTAGAVMVTDADWDTIVVAGSDPELTRKVVRAYADLVPNPNAGRYHRQVLTHCGFREVDVTGQVAGMPYPQAVKTVLEPAIMQGVKTKAFSAHDGAQFLADLQMAEERREFYFAFTTFTGTGTK